MLNSSVYSGSVVLVGGSSEIDDGGSSQYTDSSFIIMQNDNNSSLTMSETTIKKHGLRKNRILANSFLQTEEFENSGYAMSHSKLTEDDDKMIRVIDDVSDNMSIRVVHEEDELNESIENMRKTTMFSKPKSLDDYDGTDKITTNDRQQFAMLIQEFQGKTTRNTIPVEFVD